MLQIIDEMPLVDNKIARGQWYPDHLVLGSQREKAAGGLTHFANTLFCHCKNLKINILKFIIYHFKFIILPTFV